MEEQPGYIEKYRTAIRLFAEKKSLYFQFFNPSSEVDELGLLKPSPIRRDPREIECYHNLRELRMEVVKLENARERIKKSVGYCLMCIDIDKPIDKAEYQKNILPFPHWQHQVQLSKPFSFSNPVMLDYFAEQASNGLFDMSGGDFSAVHIECTNDRLTIYLIK